MHAFEVEELLPDTARQNAHVIGFPTTQAMVERFGGASFPIGRGLRSSASLYCAKSWAVPGPKYGFSHPTAWWLLEKSHAPARSCSQASLF